MDYHWYGNIAVIVVYIYIYSISKCFSHFDNTHRIMCHKYSNGFPIPTVEMKLEWHPFAMRFCYRLFFLLFFILFRTCEPNLMNLFNLPHRLKLSMWIVYGHWHVYCAQYLIIRSYFHRLLGRFNQNLWKIDEMQMQNSKVNKIQNLQKLRIKCSKAEWRMLKKIGIRFIIFGCNRIKWQ